MPYYSNICMKVFSGSNNIVLAYNELHHCTSAGIHCDKCNDTTFHENLIYGNTWWTASATSGIVFANSAGTGTNIMNGNIVYGNRNYLPFFVMSYIEHFGSGTDDYGLAEMSSIVDGQGVYITRNTDFEGTFILSNNIAFDNGINGLVVHKSTHENVMNIVEGNLIFNNGRTSQAWENRQTAGGLTVNSGDYKSYQSLFKNIVTVGEGDVPYQCFGECENLAGSADNLFCGGSPSNKFANQDVFVEMDEATCSSNKFLNRLTKLKLPPSCMWQCPQYTPFVTDECVEPPNPCDQDAPLCGEDCYTKFGMWNKAFLFEEEEDEM